MSADKEWEKWGKKDPYFGVMTDEKFRRRNLTEAAKQEFFDSGKSEIAHVLDVCRQYFGGGFAPQRVLDFGCGTGRLVIPLAAVADHVVGVDVSESMLKEAAANCAQRSITNVSLLKSDDALSCVDGEFDFIHSFIVFQHIPPERGKQIFRTLLSRLQPGGVCAIQCTYAKAAHEKNYGAPVQKPATRLFNALKRQARKTMLADTLFRNPEMQMNTYNLNQMFFVIQSLGTTTMHVEFTDHGGELGVFLFFQKPLL